MYTLDSKMVLRGFFLLRKIYFTGTSFSWNSINIIEIQKDHFQNQKICFWIFFILLLIQNLVDFPSQYYFFAIEEDMSAVVVLHDADIL